MSYLLQAITNDIYNSVDACKNAKEMWQRTKRLMFGSKVTSHVRNSRLMNEFDKFVAKEREPLESVYERAEKGTKNHDPLALLVNSNASSSQSHANSSYSPQPYYVTHPSSVFDYDDEYQGELQGDSQEDKLTNAMILLARAIAQKFSTPTNNRLADGNAETVPSYDAKAVSQVNASSKVHEQVSHVKRKTIIQITDDDQIDSNIIFDDPFMENNGSTSEHDSNAHDEYHEIQMLAYNAQTEAENQKRLNNELKKQKDLLQ
nr:hypothetical protein [Tanacetum cinerariifolium]